MKKLVSITLIMMLAITFLAFGTTNADAMNNESAALLTAGIVLFGVPVINAIARGGAYPEPAYAYAGPRYVEKTRVVYVQPKHKKHHKRWQRTYERGYRHGWERIQYRKGMRDARRDYRRGRD